jgi:hypothetical protein
MTIYLKIDWCNWSFRRSVVSVYQIDTGFLKRNRIGAVFGVLLKKR